MRAYLFIFIILLFYTSMGVFGSNFTHQMSLHPEYMMFWKFDDKEITVKVKVKTIGWIGWGLSSSGIMRGADMVIGWVDSQGTNHFHDRYGGGRYQPSIDQQQDYQLVEMREESGYTTCNFKRKLVLPSAADFTITEDPVHVLWAWNNYDPNGDYDLSYHGGHRGDTLVAFEIDKPTTSKNPTLATKSTTKSAEGSSAADRTRTTADPIKTTTDSTKIQNQATIAADPGITTADPAMTSQDPRRTATSEP